MKLDSLLHPPPPVPGHSSGSLTTELGGPHWEGTGGARQVSDTLERHQKKEGGRKTNKDGEKGDREQERADVPDAMELDGGLRGWGCGKVGERGEERGAGAR